MFTTLKKLVLDCLTENDGKSFCPVRVAGFGLAMTAIPTFITCTLYAVHHTGHFDFVGFGSAFAAMMAGLGVLAGGVALKAKTDTDSAMTASQ
jgi:hypothetical protein